MEIINGTQIAYLVKEKLKDDIKNNFIELDRAVPKLAVILVGNDPASLIYVEGKSKACGQVGISSQIFHLDEKTTENELKEVIEKLNKDKTVDGILLQLPLPKHIDENKMINLISPEKDVDGLTRVNLGKLISNDNTGLFSCTPSGIIELLNQYNVNLKGKDVVIINRSLLVGKPLAFMFLNEDSTVTICHSKTKDLKGKTSKADIVVVAVGKQGFLTQDMVKDGAIVIDVGINRNNETKKVCGDVGFENISKKASLITPVPGGVGPMTIAMLLKNTYLAAIKNR